VLVRYRFVVRSLFWIFTLVFVAEGLPPAAAQDQSLSPKQRKQLIDDGVKLDQQFQQSYRKGAYREAIAAEKKLLEISRRVFGEKHAATGNCYNSLGNVTHSVGDYAAARSYYERALKIRRTVLGEDNADTAKSYNNLGNVAKDLGDYTAARRYHERALEIRLKVLGEEHGDTAASYNNLGLLFRALGNYPAARNYHERALVIDRRVLGEDNPDTAMAYNNLGIVARVLGDYAAARSYHEQALKIRRKVLGEEHDDTAASYNNLGNVAKELSDYAAARKSYEQALEIKLKVLGEEHDSTARTCNNLGAVCGMLGDYAAARKYFEQALAIDRKVLGEEHPSTAGTYNNLAKLATDAGDWPAAAHYMDRQRRGVRRQVAKILPSLSEKEQQQFLQANDKSSFQSSLSLSFLRPQDSAIRKQSAAWLLNAKGVGQQALVERALLAREIQNPKLAPVVRRLTDVRSILAQLSLTAPKSGRAEERRQQLAELSAQESDLSRQLVQAGGTTLVGDPWIELDAVRSALSPDSILIDVARFRVAPWDDKDKENRRWRPARYVAWVIPPVGKGDVQLVDLGEADAIDGQIKALREKLEAVQSRDSTFAKAGEPKAEAELRESFGQLAQQIWKPLASQIGDAKQLFLSPDGALWLVPWGAIPIDKDKFLIEKLTINYLISGRDVVSAPQKSVSKVSAPAIFADPNFDLAPSEVREAAKAVLRGAYQNEGEGERTNDKSLLPRVGRLPGTAVEAEAVKPNVEKMAGQAPVVYADKYALESVAKALDRPKIAIFSTHGFFLPDQVLKQDDKVDRLAMASNESRAVPLTKEGKPFENPLLRCGLLFAGCNPRNEGQPGSGDDGVLTGMEIVGIDFRGTDLVVLSACETGIGTVNNGEGVAGLRQAFQLAGANAVVATLWQIPDVDSARLMNDFFANLAAGQSKGEALRNAQLKRIESRRERFGAAHPYFWAAFTLTGR
jgi:CHAT domain-containing protein/tetratricopeptide (TPR) repeat protein